MPSLLRWALIVQRKLKWVTEEILELDRDEVELVQETADERRHINEVLKDIRYTYRTGQQKSVPNPHLVCISCLLTRVHNLVPDLILVWLMSIISYKCVVFYLHPEFCNEFQLEMLNYNWRDKLRLQVNYRVRKDVKLQSARQIAITGKYRVRKDVKLQSARQTVITGK
jgi:hypothetical protein